MSISNGINKARELLIHEISGWKKLEVAWFAISILAITIVSIMTKDTVIGIVSAVTGIMSIVLTGKGKPSCYFFGTIYALTYVLITFRAAYYLSFFFELFIILPMEFAGFYLWVKHMNKETHEVLKRQMKIRTWILTILSTVVASLLLGMLMKITNDPMPFIDSFSTVTMAVAMFLAIMRYAEQWIVWIVVNVFSTILWIRSFLATGENGAVLMMWIIYIANSIIMCIKWYKDAKKDHETASADIA